MVLKAHLKRILGTCSETGTAPRCTLMSREEVRAARRQSPFFNGLDPQISQIFSDSDAAARIFLICGNLRNLRINPDVAGALTLMIAAIPLSPTAGFPALH